MESADGVDPSVDDTSSIHTVHRYAKDVTQLDLQNCHHWNRFLEIHYDSLGKDGLLSHKVFSFCCFRLTNIILYSFRRSREKKDGLKDKEKDSSKDVKRLDKSEKKKESTSSGQAEDSIKKEKNGNGMKRVPAGKTAQNEGTEDKPKDNSDPSSAAVVGSDGVPGTKKDADGNEIKTVQAVHETKNTEMQVADAENLVTEQGDGDSSKTEIKADADKDDKKDERKTGVKSGVETDVDKKKVPQNDGKNGKLKNGDISKDEKLCSLSLSLDSLLDYTDKDMQELTFELSLFAELLYEMLQYQMGSRILTFLQKLRVKFVTRRNQRKRKRDEIQAKERDKKSPVKRAKTSELLVKEQDSKSETLNTAQPNDDKTKVKEEDKSVDYVVETQKADTGEKETSAVMEVAVNKELLQAFRFFD
nr:hypothetical protein CFP56_15772 [Quercus suber]